jgi:hypothetical protein
MTREARALQELVPEEAGRHACHVPEAKAYLSYLVAAYSAWHHDRPKA